MYHHINIEDSELNEQPDGDTPPDDRVAPIRWGLWESGVAANSAPLDPGYFAAGDALYYVTEAGEHWLVRDVAGRVQLTPCERPAHATLVEIMLDANVATVAEAADLLAQQRHPGVYQDGDHRYVTVGQVWMFYGAALARVALPALPTSATRLDVVPDDLERAIIELEVAG